MFTLTSEGFWKCTIDNSILLEVKENLSKRAVNNKQTMLSDGGGVIGGIGEVVVKLFLNDSYISHNTFKFDGKIQGFAENWYTVEIKTKSIKKEPRNYYEQSIFKYSTEFQNPDFYIFVSITEPNGIKDFSGSFKDAYIIGIMPSSWIDTDKMIFRPKGSQMPGSGIIAKRDNYFIQSREIPKF